MGCKRFFLKERKIVTFLNKIDLPYCLVVFFVVCWLFARVSGRFEAFRRVSAILVSLLAETSASREYFGVPLLRERQG